MELKQAEMHNGQKGSALAVRIQGNARQNRITRILRDGTLLVQMTIDVEGESQRANVELMKILAQTLSVSTEKIEIVAGNDRPEKLVSILEMDAQVVQDRILKAIRR
jgi:uncharacterized protein YggU (UPF0235/DUF167 family)